MDRRRAAGALLALAACIATSAAAPTASNHTALDLYDEPTEGCYYNFQHYGEGDRIMTNEPCLNCTCHNRMLMCYLRVCPFTKAIGQDCTVEKRADQCCPIVTCPDVPVDLLTSTSTSSPAEYGSTGVGKVDKYGCSINGKYFSEGAKVPPTPGKPCEHCYCIRNMTTCVMQECTLHVDGCTPIYHKDVCCPVRYFCDHPEDEIPLLDDMTTTVRPTPGFLLTTTPPTEAPMTTTQTARRDCIEDDQLYPDGALIKTDKPCEHCYCMKGDIVCVVQECGTPMENEGKNCTSLPPREGQCCPDTYICEGDELNTEVPTEEPITTIVPPRRVSIEGSGYRNEPDETYTEVPTFATELEGSGEEELSEKPVKETTDKNLIDKFGTSVEAEFIPLTTQVPILEEIEKATTELDKGLNTVPSGVIEDENTDPSVQEKTTLSDILTSTESIGHDEMTTTTKIATDEEKYSEPSLVEETTPVYETKATEPSVVTEQAAVSETIPEKESPEISENETTPEVEEKVTMSSESVQPEVYTTTYPEKETVTETSTSEGHSPTDESQSLSEHEIVPGAVEQEPSEATVAPTTESDELKNTAIPNADELGETSVQDGRRTTPEIEGSTSPKVDEEEKTEVSVSEPTTVHDRFDVTEPVASDLNTVPISVHEEQITEASQTEKPTISDESKVPEFPSTTVQEEEQRETESTKPIEEESSEPTKQIDEESSEPSVFEQTTRSEISEIPVKPEDKPSDESTTETFKITVIPDDKQGDESTTVILKEKEPVITTEPIFKKDEDKEFERTTTSPIDIVKESEESSNKTPSTESTLSESREPEIKLTTMQLPEEQEQETTKSKEATTEAIMELSTFAHVSDKESATTFAPDSEPTSTVAVTEKIDLLETTTINPADNEIAEVPYPGRIPGEGDCLFEGTTYKNESIVPSTNKCHSGCKCVSSIVKCDPIICSPPPEDMDNCQPRYDTPEACCPTYVCDHGMETIPPQPQSHITGTESPTPSTIECHGDECEKVEEKQPSIEQSQIPVKEETGDCGSSGCEQTVQTPAEPCTDGKCEVSQQPTEVEQPQIPQSCANPEDCKEIKIPAPCEGESCTADNGEHCDNESGCVVKPDTIPQPETPQVCANEEECKQVKIPHPELVPCEGESCTNVQGDCSTGECAIISPPQQPSQDEICSEDSGCKKPEESAHCQNGKCEPTDIHRRVESECSGDNCLQQQPVSPTQETTHSGPASTELPTSEEVTSRLPAEQEEVQPISPELISTVTEEAVTESRLAVSGEPDKEIKEPESQVTSEQPTGEVTEQKVSEISPEEGATTLESITIAPIDYSTTTIKPHETERPDSSETEMPLVTDVEVKPTEVMTEHPEEVTESHDINVDKPEKTTEEKLEKSTEIPKLQYDETASTELPESAVVDEGTKSPEKEEQEHVTVSPEFTITEDKLETKKPEQEPEETPTESPILDNVTVKLSEETTRLTETEEPVMKATEPGILESDISNKPELSTISAFDEFETKLDASTKSPSLHETPFYEKETVSDENIQTEIPYTHVTLPQEDTETPKEDTEKLSTTEPEHTGFEDKLETTTGLSDITEKIGSVETKRPEEDVKDTTTEISAHSSISDEYVTSEYTPVKQDVPEPQATISSEEETVTPAQQAESEEHDDEKVKVTETPEPTIVKIEKETVSPSSLVTSQPQADMTTASPDTERVEEQELLTTKPELQESHDDMKPETQETVSPFETKKPEISDQTQPATEQETFTEKISTVVQDKESPVTELQKPEPEEPASVTTESAQPAVPEEQEKLTTRTPPISETEIPVEDGQVTETSHEIKLSEVPEKTTIIPLHTDTSEEEFDKVTESHVPSMTEEYEMSTEEPKISEDEGHQTTTPDMTLIETQEAITKKPDTDKSTVSSEEIEKDSITKKPIPAEEEVSAAPETTANVQPELPESVTEIQNIPEHVPEEKDTTESSVPEQEFTEIPGEFVTKQTFTESPEIHETVAQEEQLPTISSEQADTESQKLSTEQPSETKLPEQMTPQEHVTEKEEAPVTNVPEQPVEETFTKLPEMQETTASVEFESVKPEISEATTISSQIYEEKQTEEPISYVPELHEPTTTQPEERVPSETDKTEEASTESTQELVPKATIAPEEASTVILTSEEDKEPLPGEPIQTSRPEVEQSETTPYLVELEEHTHKLDEEEPTSIPSDEPSIVPSKEPTFTPSEEPTVAPSEGSTHGPSEEPTVALTKQPPEKSTEPTVALIEEPAEKTTVRPLVEPTVASSQETTFAPPGESTVSSSEEFTVFPSEKTTIVSSEETTAASPEEPSVNLADGSTTARVESLETKPYIIESSTEMITSEEKHTEQPEIETELPSGQKDETPLATQEPHSTLSLGEVPEKSTESIPIQESTSESIKPADSLEDKFGSTESPEKEDKEKETLPTTPKLIVEDDVTTQAPVLETEKPVSAEKPEKEVTVKPQYVPVETTAPEEEFIPVTSKATTEKAEEEAPTQPPATKPEEKPTELPASTAVPEISKPDELQPTDEVPSPDESHFPPSGGYNQEPDYVEEDQAFGPGTCRYGGKVYVSAQQIPRDDPCDFCFCFRSDIICLQQSCPPPIHGCHEEPIQGFCCPRYECPVSMATSLNVTTTTTTTTTTLPPHFLPHAYKGAATRKGCQIKGHTYQVGEVVRASSGPCLHCTCGGDGQMKCDPKQCTPEPMLRQMIAAAVSSKRRR